MQHSSYPWQNYDANKSVRVWVFGVQTKAPFTLDLLTRFWSFNISATHFQPVRKCLTMHTKKVNPSATQLASVPCQAPAASGLTNIAYNFLFKLISHPFCLVIIEFVNKLLYNFLTCFSVSWSKVLLYSGDCWIFGQVIVCGGKRKAKLQTHFGQSVFIFFINLAGLKQSEF